MSHAEPNEVRESVSRAYAAAVTRGSSCCGSQSSCTPTTDKAESIGYSPAELAGVPSEATGTTFGCGNPTAFSEIGSGDVVVDLGSGAGLDLILAARKVGSFVGLTRGLDAVAGLLRAGEAAGAAVG